MNSTEPGAPAEPASVGKPLMAHTAREARWILVTWLVAFVWVVGYCTTAGYIEAESELSLVLGMPSWVFWGVFLPWGVSTGVTCFLALFVMKNDSLGDQETSTDV